MNFKCIFNFFLFMSTIYIITVYYFVLNFYYGGKHNLAGIKDWYVIKFFITHVCSFVELKNKKKSWIY